MKTILTLVTCLVLVAFLTTLPAQASELHDAVKKGDKAAVEKLLSQGADVNAKDNDGLTPLHTAAHWDYTKIAELLIAKGVNLNAKDDNGWTPLHTAASLGNKGVAELLIAKGADVNAKDNYGRTPLYYEAYFDNYYGRKVTDIIINKSPNPRADMLMYINDLKKGDDPIIKEIILRLSMRVKPAPAIPEDARRYFIEGTTILKAATTPKKAMLAVDSLKKALAIAPWWGDAYYNLGAAQELAGKYDDAKESFGLYLLTVTDENEKRAVQDHIYAIDAKKKLAQ